MKIMSVMSSKNRKCHEFEKQEVLSKASLYFILMDVYQRSNDSSDHELLLTKMKLTVCLIQFKYSSILNKTL